MEFTFTEVVKIGSEQSSGMYKVTRTIFSHLPNIPLSIGAYIQLTTWHQNLDVTYSSNVTLLCVKWSFDLLTQNFSPGNPISVIVAMFYQVLMSGILKFFFFFLLHHLPTYVCCCFYLQNVFGKPSTSFHSLDHCLDPNYQHIYLNQGHSFLTSFCASIPAYFCPFST